jgi:hypothetical protein
MSNNSAFFSMQVCAATPTCVSKSSSQMPPEHEEKGFLAPEAFFAYGSLFSFSPHSTE